MTGPVQPPKSRIPPETRRDGILEVAGAVFLAAGFEAASMSAIAARLGGSKGTLYNYFASKEALFEAWVRGHCAANLQTVYAPALAGEAAPERLARLARAYLTEILSEANLRLVRVVIGAAARAPQAGQAFYAAGPLRGLERLTDWMAAWAAAGELQVADPAEAARQFIALSLDQQLMARLCAARPELSAAEIDCLAAQSVATFLRAYGPQGGGPAFGLD
jgi:AcrR family transcriptional regulator